MKENVVKEKKEKEKKERGRERVKEVGEKFSSFDIS